MHGASSTEGRHIPEPLAVVYGDSIPDQPGTLNPQSSR